MSKTHAQGKKIYNNSITKVIGQLKSGTKVSSMLSCQHGEMCSDVAQRADVDFPVSLKTILLPR